MRHLHPYRSPEGDLHIPYDIEDDSRSRFAEPRDGERESAYPTAALLRSLQWVSDGYVSLLDTAQYNKVTYYTALIDDLLWEAAWLRRDAIAS